MPINYYARFKMTYESIIYKLSPMGWSAMGSPASDSWVQ